ncbi:PilZ domain-containing protein [Desulfuromonas thiophila]|uniref:PilZ domain-containing protein n=1 Tax=Desulfuromonas thiophila TaxID=57664 RepID=A0A1G7BAS2_9BACT|nr:PilZ domain-containing protein [Desulfuromonas thiophila]SDE23345.1 PilZ domain-containing protein [Desulfuromonas thiophila]
MPEKRHFQRVPFIEQVHLCHEQQHLQGKLLDISLKGLLVELESLPPQVQPPHWQVSLRLAGDLRLTFTAEVRHCHDRTLGLAFTRMDADSMTHLRRLLELNSGDAEEIERELEWMISRRAAHLAD